MPNSASAIVTAAEPIRATFPARASKSGCRAANRNPPPRRQNQGAGPAGGDGNGAYRAPRCERSISAQCERPTPGLATRARCGRDSEATADDRRASAFLTDRTSLTPPPTSLPCAAWRPPRGWRDTTAAALVRGRVRSFRIDRPETEGFRDDRTLGIGWLLLGCEGQCWRRPRPSVSAYSKAANTAPARRCV